MLKAVAAWRERTAQTRDQPRGRILKDEAIEEIATQAPIDADGLNRLRSVPKGFSGLRPASGPKAAGRHHRERSGRSRGPYAPVIDKPKPPAQPINGAVVELLKVLLKARAEDAGVASKLIATMADLEKIAADDEAETAALEGWRREAFGEDALKLKRGEIALVLDGGRVRAVEVRPRCPKSSDGSVGTVPGHHRRCIQTNIVGGYRMKLAYAAVFAALVSTAAHAQPNIGAQAPEASVPFTITQVATFSLPWRLAFCGTATCWSPRKPAPSGW